MKNLIKNLTRKQIIIIASTAVVTLSAAGVTTAVLLNNDDNNLQEEQNTCLVEFDTSGGTTIETKKITCGSKISEPDKPEKIGFEFLNWSYNNTAFDFNTKIDKNITLTATYNKTTTEEILTVTFNSNGGSEVKPIELVKGTTINEPVKPTFKGYTFEGWYINNNTKFNFNEPINENITLTAKWTKDNSQTGTQKPNQGNQGNQGTTNPNPEPKPEESNPVDPKPETPVDPKPEEKPKITKITVDKSEVGGKVGASYNVNVRVYSGNTNQRPTFTSSNETIATVEKLGADLSSEYDEYLLKITVKDYGTATITIKSPDGTVQNTIKVNTPYISVTGVTLSDYNLTLHVGETYTITSTIAPLNAIQPEMIWTSSDQNTVRTSKKTQSTTSTAELLAKKAGTVTITVTTREGNFTASCTVTVIE